MSEIQMSAATQQAAMRLKRHPLANAIQNTLMWQAQQHEETLYNNRMQELQEKMMVQMEQMQAALATRPVAPEEGTEWEDTTFNRTHKFVNGEWTVLPKEAAFGGENTGDQNLLDGPVDPAFANGEMALAQLSDIETVLDVAEADRIPEDQREAFAKQFVPQEVQLRIPEAFNENGDIIITNNPPPELAPWALALIKSLPYYSEDQKEYVVPIEMYRKAQMAQVAEVLRENPGAYVINGPFDTSKNAPVVAGRGSYGGIVQNIDDCGVGDPLIDFGFEESAARPVNEALKPWLDLGEVKPQEGSSLQDVLDEKMALPTGEATATLGELVAEQVQRKAQES